MNEAQLRKNVLASLGHPVVCVVLTNKPELLTEAIHDTYRWFNAHKGLRDRRELLLTASVNEYTLLEDVLDVLDVIPPRSTDIADLLSGGFSEFGDLFIGGLYFGGYGYFGGGYGNRDQMPYSGMIQTLQMNETVSKLFGSEFDWEFFEPQSKLYVYPVPSEARRIVYDCKIALTNISQVKDGSIDADLLVRYARAASKEIVGRIRRKFDSIPGAEESISLDGDRLLDDAATEIEALTTRINETAFPIPFFAK